MASYSVRDTFRAIGTGYVATTTRWEYSYLYHFVAGLLVFTGSLISLFRDRTSGLGIILSVAILCGLSAVLAHSRLRRRRQRDKQLGIGSKDQAVALALATYTLTMPKGKIVRQLFPVYVRYTAKQQRDAANALPFLPIVFGSIFIGLSIDKHAWLAVAICAVAVLACLAIAYAYYRRSLRTAAFYESLVS